MAKKYRRFKVHGMLIKKGRKQIYEKDNKFYIRTKKGMRKVYHI